MSESVKGNKSGNDRITRMADNTVVNIARNNESIGSRLFGLRGGELKPYLN